MPSKTITERQEYLVKKLYQQYGSTGSRVALKLGISLKQVYDALRRQEVPRKSLLEQNRIRFERSPLSFTFKKTLSGQERELYIAGLMLYYGEGAKTGVTVDFTNSDPKAVKLFLKFLRQIYSVNESKIRFYLYCFSDQDVSSLIKFWCSQLRVEQQQFTKPYVRSTLNKGKRTMSNGVLHVRYSDKRLLEKVLAQMNELVSTL
ncbi:MAG: hypothetical protein AAB452_00305 [Patescibacteria group bacterium]